MNTFYEYNAKITRVVDGDTIDALVDLGFHVQMNLRFRLTGFDAPETYRPKSNFEAQKGAEATEALKVMLAGKDVIIECKKFGKYRWLGTIYKKGFVKSINQIMIDMGHTKEAMHNG